MTRDKFEPLADALMCLMFLLLGICIGVYWFC
jgi:hypothetical protein